MNQFIVRSLLSIACAAVTTIALTAQSAIVVKEQDPAPGREQVRVRLAEVISLLEDEDLSPAQRDAAKAKLHEILAQLDKERDAVGRAKHRIVEVQQRDGSVVQLADPVDFATVQEHLTPGTVLRAEPAEPPAPPAPLRKPKMRTPRPQGGRVVDVAPEAAPPDGREAHPRLLPGRAETDEARLKALEFLQRKSVELDNAAAEMRVRERVLARAKQEAEHAARVADEAKVEAQAAEEGAGAMPPLPSRLRLGVLDAARAEAAEENLEAMPSLRGQFGKVRAEAPKERGRKRVRVVEQEHADTDDLRAMVEEMREEMREIRSLIHDLRAHAHDGGHDGPFGGEGTAPAHGLGSDASSSNELAPSHAGGMSSSSAFDSFAPAQAFGSGADAFSASVGTAPSMSFGGFSATGGTCGTTTIAPLPGQCGVSGRAAVLAPAAKSSGQGGCCNSSSASAGSAPKSVN